MQSPWFKKKATLMIQTHCVSAPGEYIRDESSLFKSSSELLIIKKNKMLNNCTNLMNNLFTRWSTFKGQERVKRRVKYFARS